MEKRLITAVALSVLIIITFQYFTKQPVTRTGVPVATKEMAKEPISAVGGAELALETEPAITEEIADVATDRYSLVLSNAGGSIKSVVLKDFTESGDRKKPLALVELSDPREYLFALSGIVDGKRLDTTAYEKKALSDGNVAYVLRINGLEIAKQFIFDRQKYLIEMRLSVKNSSNSTRELDYRIVGGAGLAERDAQDKRFVEVTAKLEDRNVKFKRPKEGRVVNPGAVLWSALKNKYFSIIIKPFVRTKSQFYEETRPDHFVMGINPEAMTIPAGGSAESRFIMYVGPSQTAVLNDHGYGFSETIDYGFFGWISTALIALLRFFYNLFHSWGLAIILLSVVLNLVLFPMTIKSFKSMKKMQELHPQMEKLKVQFKDNPQKLNKEMMELYKTYKINPLSGCLPLILQMPIFIALYNGLMRSIELRGASFLWVRDLSMPEAIPLPISLPIIGGSINILPLVMVGAMVLQQKLSTKSMGGAVTDEQRQQQKIMLIMMPIMFGFIFYNMPSGLVLYWLINTFLTIAEQSAIFKEA